MIVSYEGIRGGLLLREIETEEEAFAEMRRYLEVNNISSNYTEVRWKEVNEKCGILTRCKHVAMGHSRGGGIDFGIYYEGKPTHLEFDPEERSVKYEESPSRYEFSYRFKNSKIEFICWYDEVAEYFRDLAERKAGGE